MKQFYTFILIAFSVSKLVSQDLTLGCSPGLYSTTFNTSLGNKIILGYTRHGNFTAPIPGIDSEDRGMGFLKLSSFQNASIGYLRTLSGEEPYGAITLPLTLGLGVTVGELKKTTLGILGNFEAIYPIRKFSSDPVHGNIAGGAFIERELSEKFNLSFSTEYGVFIGQSSLKNSFTGELWIGYKLK